LFEQIRSACQEVAEGAQFVRIDCAGVLEYARSLASGGVPFPALDQRSHFLGHGDRTLAFIVILDTVNFGSGWFPHLRKRAGKSGSFTIASSLSDAFSSGEDFSAQRLSRISATDCARVFGQDLAPPVGELMERFSQALNQLGACSWIFMAAASRRWLKAPKGPRSSWCGS
jgi:hypothetical protein